MREDLRLLIVDDEKVEREAIRFFAASFTPRFAAIEEAENGIEAVEIARTFRPDIIVLDIRLPGRSGIEAATEIRAMDDRVRILFQTAYGELEYARAAFKVRADDFMVKPVSAASFREAMGRAVLSLQEAGAIGHEEITPGAGRQSTETALLDRIRRGLPDEAENVARRLFNLEAGDAAGVQEARRVSRLVLALIDRKLREEFGRSFETGVETVRELRRARERGEVCDCLARAARSFADEAAVLKADPHRKAVDAALAFIAERWKQPITLEDVSRAVGLSRYHFSRVFHAAVGTTFTDYLCALRLRHAKELLADSSLPMKQICESSGFADPAYFSSVFKKREGMNPSEFRALAAAEKSAKICKRSHKDETRDPG